MLTTERYSTPLSYFCFYNSPPLGTFPSVMAAISESLSGQEEPNEPINSTHCMDLRGLERARISLLAELYSVVVAIFYPITSLFPPPLRLPCVKASIRHRYWYTLKVSLYRYVNLRTFS